VSRAVRTLTALALVLTLGACAHRQPKPADSSLGLDAQSSPGDVYVELAAEYFRLGQMDSAVRRAEQGVSEDPKNPRAYYVLALIYQRLGENERAEKNFKQALELSPKNPEFLQAYGVFQCAQGRYAEADAQFAKALENPIYSTPWVTLYNAGTCAALAGNGTKSEEQFRRAASANPRYGPALFKMAEFEYNRGNYKVAEDWLTRYFQGNAPTPGTLALAVKTERKLGNRKAAATYEQLLRKNFPGASETMEL
jgi:type IV pilus assembly protein PilF